MLAGALFLGIGSLCAQRDYEGAVGVRIGTPFGASGKYFLTQDVALEGFFGSRRSGYEFGMLGLWHHDFGWKREYNWYYGGGTHLGFSEYSNSEEGRQRSEVTFGFAAALGVEYTMREIPLNIAVDWKPEMNFAGVTGLHLLSGGVSVRYTFDRFRNHTRTYYYE